MKVFVTGAASALARAVLPALCAHAHVSNVRGLDARAVRYTHSKFEAIRGAVGDDAVAGQLRGFDALVHLAFSTPRPDRDAAALFDLNVRAAHKLFHAARAAGMKRLVHVSTAAVYGAAIHANEQAALKPLPGFTYAEHHAHLEQLLSIEFPECARLRPHIVLGPHAHSLLKLLLRQPFHLKLPEPQPLFQCVHEADVAQAIVICLERDARGAYNLAADESFSLRDALRARHRVSVGMQLATARRAVDFGARLAGRTSESAWLDALSQTLLVNCRRAIVELGWQRRYDGRETLLAT